MSYDLVLQGRFVDPVSGIFNGFMGIEAGRIAYLTEKAVRGKTMITMGKSELAFPGFIDTHVHFREPGGEHKGNIASESMAAAAGGVTTAMDMPNTGRETTNRERVLEKIRLAKEKSVIDMLFYGGVGPGNVYVLEEMADLVPAYKMFLSKSTGNLTMESLEQAGEAFSVLSGLGKPLAVHCEDEAMNRQALAEHDFEEHGPRVHGMHRPPESEEKAVKDALAMAEKHGVPLSVCHVSTRGGLEAVLADGSAMSEVTPHHCMLGMEDMDRLGSMGKMNPPLRERQDSDFVLDSLLKGRVSFIGTDHAPHTLEEKSGGFMEAPSGIPSVEFYGGFAAWLLSRGMDPKDLARATSYNAARFFGLEGKGRIEEGFVADVTVLDTSRRVVVGPPYAAKCGWSPFEGMELPGGPSITIKSGRIIAENGKVVG